ncbi:hypothetical protein WHZ77_05990 [Bradyrhizobium sp. A5]|uniref:hypothetical protein n=1 Tax=Bradyrhizobium sp. A5 TaxID=3133696 RepID=UPI00324EE99E
MTPHWQLIEKTFRAIAPRNWRRAAAKALGVDKQDLRDTYDREDLSSDEINALLVVLENATTAAQKALDARAKHISAAGTAVSVAQNERYIEQCRIEQEFSDDGERYRVYHAKLIAELEEAA